MTLPAIVSFTANPEDIVAGGSSTLRWTTTSAASITINDGSDDIYTTDSSSRVTSGSYTVRPTTTTTYTLTAMGPNASLTDTETVTVTAMAVEAEVETPAPPTIDSFTANPTEITAGNSSNLTWTTTDATSVAINGVTATLDVDGNTDVSPTVTTIYTLTAIGPGGLVTATATVTVGETEPPDAPTIDSFTATPSSIEAGESSLLQWRATGATSVAIGGVPQASSTEGAFRCTRP